MGYKKRNTNIQILQSQLRNLTLQKETAPEAKRLENIEEVKAKGVEKVEQVVLEVQTKPKKKE